MSIFLKNTWFNILSLSLFQTMYENDVALANEKLEDIAHCIRDYREKVINEVSNLTYQ